MKAVKDLPEEVAQTHSLKHQSTVAQESLYKKNEVPLRNPQNDILSQFYQAPLQQALNPKTYHQGEQHELSSCRVHPTSDELARPNTILCR